MVDTVVRLFYANGEEADVWLCVPCNTAYTYQGVAEACHGIRNCAECGASMDRPHVYSKTLCDTCSMRAIKKNEEEQEHIRYDAATKIMASDYTGGWVFTGDRYYQSINDALMQNSKIKYVWATKNVGLLTADLDDIIQPILDSAWEDADIYDLNGVDELQKAIIEFNKANDNVPVYMVDFTAAIIIDGSGGPGL